MKNTYPNPLEKWSKKKEDAYGLAFAKAIGSDWFGGGVIGSGCAFANNQLRIRENRQFVRAEHSTDEFKKLFANEDGETSMANLNFENLNHANKFCRIVSNGIQDSNYKIDIRAKDRISLTIKKESRDRHLRNMRSLPLLKQVQKQLGLDIMPKGFIPKNEEELNIHEQLKEKPKIEIAEEIIIDYVKKSNNWSNLEKEKNKNLVNIGITAARIYTDPNDGIKINDIDEEYLVYSLVNKNDFSDSHYFGYVDTITIGDIARESNFDDKALREIAKLYSKKYEYTADFNNCAIDKLHGFQIDVLRFAFKTSKKTTYKKYLKKGKATKIAKRTDDYQVTKRKDYEIVESVKGTWMEGSYVIGTDYIYEYKESENIVRDELNRPLAPFVVRATDIYKNRIKAFLDDIKPLAKELQSTHLKMQHLRSEIKPDFIVIDEDVLAAVDEEGNRTGEFDKNILNILNIKGIIIQKRVNMGEDGIKDGSPARQVATPQGAAMGVLLNHYMHYYNMIRDVTGLNPAADGSLPHDALLGVSRMNQLSANTATAHIVDAAVDFNKRVAEVISTRVHAIFRNPKAKHLREMLEKAVGKRNIEAVEVLKDRHLHDFGFTVEMLSTQQEMQEFKEDMALYLQQGLITPEIKSEATRIAKTSLKLASQYLAYMSKKRQEEIRQQQEHTMQMKTQSDIAAAKQASEGRIQEEAIKTKMKLQYESAMSNIRVAEKQAMLQIEAPSKDVKFQQDVYLEKIKGLAKINEAEFKEDRKDDRLNTQSTHQSKLINQRQKDLEPMNFENNFDNIFVL